VDLNESAYPLNLDGQQAYYGSVEFIHGLPLLLPRLHDIYLVVFEIPLSLYVLDHSFRGVTQRAGAPSKEGNPALQQPRRRPKHVDYTSRKPIE
jgi:hypothetical protein